jgi:putative intracellular protease/amidase
MIALTLSESKKQDMKNILFVLTSNDSLGSTGNKTGFWIEEFAAPYYTLTDAGHNVTLASPKGGQPPIDPNSATDDAATPATQRFDKDEATQKKLANTHKLDSVKQEDYDAVFYPCGHGVLWDLVEDQNSINLIESFYNNNKPVAFVCHAPAVLKNVKSKNEPLVKGKKVTGFTNEEEAAVQLTDVVPFLLEDMLKANGGDYSKIGDWQPYAVEDGLLITGQNPASSEKVAELLNQKLK